MNNLSILIYLAGVLGNVQGFLFGCTLMFGFCTLLYTFFYVMEEGQKPPYLKRLIAFTFFLGITTSILPSSGTVYAIAASEMGEVVVKTPEAQEVLQALKGKILEQLEPATKE